MPADKIDSVRWEAAQWVERRMDDASFDGMEFDHWIAADPRHRPAFDAIWRRIMGPEMGAALRDYGRRKAAQRKTVAGVAAALLVFAGGYKAMPLVELRLATPTEYAAPDGAIREIALADGTSLTLGGGAKVNVRYTGHDRVVELSRGALFARVLHDGRRPFRIETGDAEIVDVGTSFEVVSRPSAVRVTVAEGSVDFARAGWFGNHVRLKANEAAALDDTGLNRLPDVDAGDVAAWRGEWIEYRGRPLRQVVADLQALSSVPIQIAGDQIGARPVSGRIRLTDPMGQLENLALIQGFHVRRNEKAIVIY